MMSHYAILPAKTPYEIYYAGYIGRVNGKNIKTVQILICSVLKAYGKRAQLHRLKLSPDS